MPSVTINMTNPALPGAPTTIYAGVPAVLNLALTNTTGGAIGLDAGAQLEIFMPHYFSDAAVQKMNVDQIAPSGWQFSKTSDSLLLSWTGGKGAWNDGATVAFTIGNVLTDAAPDTDAVQVNLNKLSGSGVPLNVSAALVLTLQPVPGRIDLRKTLGMDNQDGGIVYVSTEVSTLNNTLYLNLKNIGAKPLYHGATRRKMDPQVRVSFVYGTTGGSLAPADKQQSAQTGSAWGIACAVLSDQGGGWQVQNPRPTDQSNTPVWTMTPTAVNNQVIGVGDQSNITFAFTNVVSLTPVGATQMYVQLSGFMADENTYYEDTVFVLPLTKRNPPNPGLLGIYSLVQSVTVDSDTQQLEIPLAWNMFGVGSVRLGFYIQGGPRIKGQDRSYGATPPALHSDKLTLSITGIKKSQVLLVSCSAYSDNNWQHQIGGGECSVPLLFPPAIDGFSIAPAPIAPPYSYAFLLEWRIKGEEWFELVEDDGIRGPKHIDLPQTATSYIAHPTSPKTVYTLNLYAGGALKQEA